MSKEFCINTLVLKLFFRGFSFPKESRFLKIFQSSNRLTNTVTNKNKRSSLNIEPLNVANGKDKRTTIIIKNLPNDISKEELKSILEPLGNINFIYIPILIKNKNKSNLPYAYVNVINYKTILKIIQNFKQIKLLNSNNYSQDFSKIQIFYSRTQGKLDLIKRFNLGKKYLPSNQKPSFS